MEPTAEADKRTHERMAVDALLEALCGERKNILHELCGKPYLEDGSYRISISHTRGYAAVILHPHQEVGIDIEQYGTKVVRVREKFLQPEELEEAGETDVYRLLLYWSAKETIYKALGVEEVELRRHIRILPFVMDGNTGCMEGIELKSGTCKRFPMAYLLHQDFVLTYTVDQSLSSCTVK